MGDLSLFSNIILCDQDVLEGKAATLETVSFSMGPFSLWIRGKGKGGNLMGGKDFADLQCSHLSSAPGPLVWSGQVAGASIVN